MKWISDILRKRCIPEPAAKELDDIEEQLWAAHKIIKRIAGTTWEDEHRILCRAFLRRYPEPEEPSGDS